MIRTMIAQFEEYDRKIFWMLLSLIGVASIAYAYFLSASVYAVIERRTAETTATRLAAKISVLESEYSALDRKISLDLAHAQGFIDVSVPRYISSRNVPETLTLRTTNSQVR